MCAAGWMCALTGVQVCVQLSCCTCLHLPGVSPNEVISLLPCSCFLLHCKKTHIREPASQIPLKANLCDESICRNGLHVPFFSGRFLNQLMSDVTLTWLRFQLLIFLFPPFPGLEDAPQTR